MVEDVSIPVAVLGASGYSGGELLRLAVRHRNIKITALSAEQHAGQSLGEVFPHLDGLDLPKLEKINDLNWGDVMAVFCCLPHGTTQEIVKSLPDNIKVIDLSADFRLSDINIYAHWYGRQHLAPKLQETAVYALTELRRDEIRKCRIAACPGCYPTTALLPLVPLLSARQIEPDGIIIDAKSGVSGAGRAAKQATLFTEVSEGIHAYGLDGHRHGPEIDQELTLAAGRSITAYFTPHLVPMNRGILATIYVKLADGVTADDLRLTLQKQYSDEPFVRILQRGLSPATRHVIGSNQCVIGIFGDRIPGQAILLSVTDNLVKGAAGQAIQNFNLMFNLGETTALEQLPIFP